MNFYTLSALLLTTTLACGLNTPDRARVISPDKTVNSINWTPAEQAKPIAVRLIRKTKNASYHFLRLGESEKPHYHDTHDLTISVLSGSSTIHFKNRSEVLHPGDVIHIPRGTYHWAGKTGSNAVEVFVVFSPPFDGKDRRFAE